MKFKPGDLIYLPPEKRKNFYKECAIGLIINVCPSTPVTSGRYGIVWIYKNYTSIRLNYDDYVIEPHYLLTE